MLTLSATCFLYLACYGFFHASPKRTAYRKVKDSRNLQRITLMGSWALSLISLISFSAVTGVERGIPMWLGTFTAVGSTSLILSALWPKIHTATGHASAVTALIFGTCAFIGAQA